MPSRESPSSSCLLLRRHARPELDTARQAPLVVSEQTDDDARDIFRLELPRALFTHGAAAKLCVDRAGHDVADLDVVVPDLLHERLAEAVEGELRGVVGGHPWMWVRARQRRDVEDVAAAPLLQLRDSGTAAMEGAEQVRLKHRAELFGRGLFDRLEEPDSSVVDKHVHAAELLDGVRDKRLDLFIDAHVTRRTGRRSTGAFTLAPRLLHLIETARADAHVHPFFGQSLRDGEPDALRPARDDCGLPLVVHLENYSAFSFSFKSSLTTFGLALPFEAFITCPTKKPKSASLPLRYASSCCGFASSTSATIFSISPASEPCASPNSSMTAFAPFSVLNISSNTSLPCLPLMRPSSTARTSAPNSSGETGEASAGVPAASSSRSSSPLDRESVVQGKSVDLG